jgi:putative PIN family toxin of toxin-antitoxin system
MPTRLTRFVFDTNAIVSAVLLPNSKPRQAFDMAKRIGTILISEDAIDELNDVLRRKDFDKYVTEALRTEFLVALLRDAELVETTETIVACRDPRDDKFLSLAVSGHANCIVSGDKDLRDLSPFREIAILTPAQFLEREWARDSE